MMVGSAPYLMPVTVLTRVRMVRMWFLYSWMAFGSVKKSSQSVAVVVQLVYAHLHKPVMSQHFRRAAMKMHAC